MLQICSRCSQIKFIRSEVEFLKKSLFEMLDKVTDYIIRYCFQNVLQWSFVLFFPVVSVGFELITLQNPYDLSYKYRV